MAAQHQTPYTHVQFETNIVSDDIYSCQGQLGFLPFVVIPSKCMKPVLVLMCVCVCVCVHSCLCLLVLFSICKSSQYSPVTRIDQRACSVSNCITAMHRGPVTTCRRWQKPVTTMIRSFIGSFVISWYKVVIRPVPDEGECAVSEHEWCCAVFYISRYRWK